MPLKNLLRLVQVISSRRASINCHCVGKDASIARYPQIFAGASADKALLGKLQEGLEFLNTFLEGNKYAAGNELTLADLSLVATVSTIDAAGVSLQEYPNVERWFELVKKTASNYEEANGKGIQEFKAMVKNLLPKSEL